MLRIDWDHKRLTGTEAYFCGHCGNRGSPLFWYRGSTTDPLGTYHRLSICAVCTKPTYKEPSG
ncbi:MAG: hypothetical protein QGH20_12365, partial [Candidatus Latescibacteria bacterium]|nr:hypothetical protein [Candidatus Latescibacterota bacterium]